MESKHLVNSSFCDKNRQVAVWHLTSQSVVKTSSLGFSSLLHWWLDYVWSIWKSEYNQQFIQVCESAEAQHSILVVYITLGDYNHRTVWLIFIVSRPYKMRQVKSINNMQGTIPKLQIVTQFVTLRASI